MNWDNIRPGNDADLDYDAKEPVPQEVLARYAGKKRPQAALGLAVKRETGGTHVVRTIDGVVYIVPSKQKDS